MRKKDHSASRTYVASNAASGSCRAKPSELRLLLLIVTTTLGVLVCGWVVSRLPSTVSAEASFKRFFRKDMAGVARTSDEIKAELLALPAVIAFAEQNARVTGELDSQNAVSDLRDRITVTLQPFDAGSDAVTFRVSGSSPAWCREIAQRMTHLYVENGKSSETYREHAAQFARAEAKFQQAEAEWHSAQSSLHDLEAELEFAQGDETAHSLQEIRLKLEKLTAQRDRFRKVLHSPVLQMPMAPPLVHPARGESPTIAAAALGRYLQRREELAATYTAQHPAVISLDRKIAELSRQCQGDEIQTVAAYTSAPPSQTSVDRALIDRKIAECERKMAELAASEAELAARVEGWQQGAEQRAQLERQRAEKASRNRLLAMHEMAKASDAIRHAERHQTVHFSLTEGDANVRYEGWDRRKWYLAVLAPWLTAMGLLTSFTIRRNSGTPTQHSHRLPLRSRRKAGLRAA